MKVIKKTKKMNTFFDWNRLVKSVDQDVEVLEFEDSRVSLNWETGLAHDESGHQVARFIGRPGTYDAGWDFHKPLAPASPEMVEHRAEFLKKEAFLLHNKVADLLREIAHIEAGINSDARPRNEAAKLADQVFALERAGIIQQGEGPVPSRGLFLVIPKSEGPGGGEKWFPLNPLHSEVYDYRGHCRVRGHRIENGVATPFPKRGARAWVQTYQFTPSNDD